MKSLKRTQQLKYPNINIISHLQMQHYPLNTKEMEEAAKGEKDS